MHDPLPKADLHIISGGPGSGKSTLLQCLKEKGYTAMPEAGRSIIRQQMAQWGQALPWADRAAYARLMLAWELKALDQARQLSGPVFFDRGLPDIIDRKSVV